MFVSSKIFLWSKFTLFLCELLYPKKQTSHIFINWAIPKKKNTFRSINLFSTKNIHWWMSFLLRYWHQFSSEYDSISCVRTTFAKHTACVAVEMQVWHGEKLKLCSGVLSYRMQAAPMLHWLNVLTGIWTACFQDSSSFSHLIYDVFREHEDVVWCLSLLTWETLSAFHRFRKWNSFKSDNRLKNFDITLAVKGFCND